MYRTQIFLVLLALAHADVCMGALDSAPVDMEDNAGNDDVSHGLHAGSDFSDEINLMQGGMRVSRASNLEVVVQKAVQEAITAQNDKIASLEKGLKQKNDELRLELQQERDKRASLEKEFFKRHQELSRSNEQMHEKLTQQAVKHEQLRKEHRLNYGMLLQACGKGQQGSARASMKRANATGVARGNKRKFAPDVVDDAIEIGEDAVDIVEDAVDEVYDTVSDLPADVADWTLEQLENLKSLVGLNWNDIPGLSDALNAATDFAISESTKIVNAAVAPINTAVTSLEGAVVEVRGALAGVNNFVVETVELAMDSVTDWVSILERELKKVTNYVTELYNKYLKPIITMIWDCASNAKSAVDFIVCTLKPVLEKIMDAMVPLGAVAEAMPFPFDDESLQIDPESGVYTLQQTCFDCQEGDMRDLAPLACDKKELDFLSIFKVTAHACNVPFMPGQCGGSMISCLKKKASQCAKGALLWAPSGVLSKLSGPVEQAMQLANSTLQKVTHWTSEARALHEKVKAFQQSSEEGVKDVLSKLMSAVEYAKDSKASVIQCLKAMGRLSSAKNLNQMVKNVEKVIAEVEELIAATEGLVASVEAVQTSFESLSSSTEAEVQDFYTKGTSDMEALKSDIDTTKDDLIQLYQNSKGVADELLQDFQAALATPLDQLEDLANFALKCATARESYQKVYVDVEVASITAGRLSVHERDGVKLAHIKNEIGASDIYHEEWPWSTLASKTGADIELCLSFYCLKFNLKLRKNPSNILGLPIMGSLGLDSLKFLELEYRAFSYNFNVIGVPYKLTDPTGIRLPSITLPLLVNTDEPAQDPANNATDVLNALWQKVVENEFEAQQIADGQATAPSLPAGATSANDINQIQSEVDEGLHIAETAPTFPSGPTPDWSTLARMDFKLRCGDRFVQIGSWRLGDVDGVHFSISHEHGQVARIYRSDGTVHPGPRTDFTTWDRPLGPASGISVGDRVIQIGQWRVGDYNGVHFSVAHRDGKTALIYTTDGNTHPGPRTDFTTWDRPLGAPWQVAAGDSFIQLGEWRLGDSSGVHFSIAHKDGQTCEVFREDGTLHQGPRTDYTSWDRSLFPGILAGDRFIQLGNWRLGDVDGVHFSIAHKDGQTALIYRSDGTVHPGPRTHFTTWDRPLGLASGISLGERFIQIGQWRVGDYNGVHFSVAHGDGKTALIYTTDGNTHSGPRTDFTTFDRLPFPVSGISVGESVGEEFIQLGEWRLGNFDDYHFSIAHKDGQTCQVFRNDGTVHQGPRTDWNSWERTVDEEFVVRET